MIKRIEFNGCKMFVNDAFIVHQMVDQNGLNYEKHVRKELELLAPSAKVMFDIGANIGIHTVSAKQINPSLRVFCFEMSPPNYQILFRTVGMNNWTDVHVLPVAVYDRNGMIGINECPDNPVTGEHGQRYPMWSPCYRMDFFNLPKPDIIKIDIEGAELAAFRGMGDLLSSKPTILFEHNFECTTIHGFSVYDVPMFLVDLGYKIIALDYKEGLRAEFLSADQFVDYVRNTTGGMMDAMAVPL